jgi:hypothetical protein
MFITPHDLSVGADGFALQDVLYSVILKTWVPASGTASGTSRHQCATPSLALDARDYLVFHMDHAGVRGDAEMQVVLEYALFLPNSTSRLDEHVIVPALIRSWQRPVTLQRHITTSN